MDALTPRIEAMLPVSFHRCVFSSLRAEGEANGTFLAHWMEATANPSLPLNVDWRAFEAIEAAGMEVCVAARRGDRLIGYAVYMVYPALHYRGHVIGDSDVFFLEPEDRTGWTGVWLLQEAENALRERGVREVYQHVKLHVQPGRGGRDLGPLFRFLGYRAVETIYRKRL